MQQLFSVSWGWQLIVDALSLRQCTRDTELSWVDDDDDDKKKNTTVLVEVVPAVCLQVGQRSHSAIRICPEPLQIGSGTNEAIEAVAIVDDKSPYAMIPALEGRNVELAEYGAHRLLIPPQLELLQSGYNDNFSWRVLSRGRHGSWNTRGRTGAIIDECGTSGY